MLRWYRPKHLVTMVSMSTSKMVLISRQHIYHCAAAMRHHIGVGNCGLDHTTRLETFPPFPDVPTNLFHVLALPFTCTTDARIVRRVREAAIARTRVVQSKYISALRLPTIKTRRWVTS